MDGDHRHLRHDGQAGTEGQVGGALIKVLRFLGFAALAVAVLAYPAAWAIDRAAGTEALIVSAADEASVDANRGLWELNGKPKGEVASIYGTPSKEPARLIAPPAEKILHPKEDPSLTLYLAKGSDHPLQAQTLWYFAPLAIVGAFVAVFILVQIAALCTVYRKAGKKEWAAIVPVYNIVVLLEIVGRPAWWTILWFIPIAGLVANIIVTVDLAKSFGKGTAYALGLIFLGFIFTPMLAWGDATYVGPSVRA